MFDPKLGVSLHCISCELTPDILRDVCASRIATLEITPTLFDTDTPEETVAMLVGRLRGSMAGVAGYLVSGRKLRFSHSFC